MRAFWLPVLVLVTFGFGGCSGDDLTKNDLPVRCLDKPEPGPCGKHLIRYFYDYRYDSCRSFHYGGCNGHVPFETQDACEEACVGGRG